MEAKALVNKPVIPRLSPEQQVLLGAIRVDGAQEERLREILARGLDWPLLRQMALSHEVLPLLYIRLKALGEDLLPTDELEQLRALYLANVHRTLRLTQKLLRALDLLAGRGIEALPFKGPALAVQAYGEVSLRQFVDLDILIHPQNFRPTYELLVNAGYGPLFPMSDRKAEELMGSAQVCPDPAQPHAVADRRLRRWMRHVNHLGFSGHDCMLEVHWAVAPRFLASRLDPERFWQGLQSAYLNGRGLPVFSPENTALTLCLHGARHRWYQLKGIADLAHLVQRYPTLDGASLLEQSEGLGLRRILCLGLQLAEVVGGAALQPAVRTLVYQDVHARELAHHVQGLLFVGKQSDGHNGLVARLLFDLRSRDHLQDQLCYLFERILYSAQRA